MRLTLPPGIEDVLPQQVAEWHYLEAQFRHHAHLFGYQEIRTPTYEFEEVFTRTVGETSDIVSKEMFKVVDSGNRNLVLKPETTAPVMRSVIENALCPPGVTGRFCYISSPHFRMERQQKGRLREHHQVGCELLGVSTAAGDAEVIELGYKYLVKIGINDLKVSINSLGREDCRRRYSEALLEHFESWLKEQPSELQAKVQKNPLRLLDNKAPEIREIAQSMAPISGYLEDASRARFEEVQTLLADAGVAFEVDYRIVRGLDYYTETVFEILDSDHLGSQSAVIAGGRYDKLCQSMDGHELAAVGFGSGVERQILSRQARGLTAPSSSLDAVIVFDPSGLRQTLNLMGELRRADLSVTADLNGASFKSQMRKADKAGAAVALFLGETELASGTVTLKNLNNGSQETVSLADVAAAVRRVSRG